MVEVGTGWKSGAEEWGGGVSGGRRADKGRR